MITCGAPFQPVFKVYSAGKFVVHCIVRYGWFRFSPNRASVPFLFRTASSHAFEAYRPFFRSALFVGKLSYQVGKEAGHVFFSSYLVGKEADNVFFSSYLVGKEAGHVFFSSYLVGKEADDVFFSSYLVGKEADDVFFSSYLVGKEASRVFFSYEMAEKKFSPFSSSSKEILMPKDIA